ncbi:hypothetical protein FIU86_04350 [Roseovarius sp. THAF9]|uniref:hypothetical protein n=1 Tax=Roseovarius sp. THAF9 TaxID=2587847 RepID=UPI0012691F8D|nr:hypothetical protein [Roseovarius sp. THAF9]QFT92062.1 hypothetical protein FIU86_04350 [Roseovarius sp. THAF9]
MLKVIDGPKSSTLNDNADGPFAFADRSQLAAHAATEWLYEYAADNVNAHDGSWSDWNSAEDIADTYCVVLEDEHGNTLEEHLEVADLTPRGAEILNAAIRDEGEGIEDLLDAWAEDIWEESNHAD